MKERDSLVEELLELHQEVTRVLQLIGRQRGLTESDLRALRFVARHPGCTVKAMREVALVTSGTATVLVDRLEREGLMVRAPNPSDRRSWLLTATSVGEAVVDELRGAVLRTARNAADHGSGQAILGQTSSPGG